MKKTLLIAAAALAAGIISTQASSVYSQNIVGYYNTTINPNQFLLVGPQMQDSSGTFNVNNVLSNGVPDGSTMFIWTGTTYGTTLTYYAGFGWYDSLGNFATNTLGGGTAGFLLSGDTVNTNTFTCIGNVPQGNFSNQVTSGFGVYSIPFPISAGIDSTNVNFPAQDGDTYFYWNPTNQNYNTTYTYYAGYGWYDSLGSPASPTPKVGEGFFYLNANAPATWTNSFSAQ